MGRHLTEHLLGQGIEVIGVNRRVRREQESRLTFFSADLREREPIARILEETRPDLIFHLAAQAHVPTSFADPAATLINNAVCQLNLFDGILRAKLDCPILIPGSNEEYGNIRQDELPLREETPFRPTNPYAVSKVAQDMLAYQYSLTSGLKCVRIRPFNHTGPGQTSIYVVPGLAKQIAEAEVGITPPVIRVGNLAAERDFTDVRDIVRGYHLALLHCEPGEVYNLGSDRAVSIRQILDFFLARSSIPLRIEQEVTRIRPWDTPKTLCDSTKFRRQTGWQPEIPFQKTLADVLDYWRQVVAKQPHSEVASP